MATFTVKFGAGFDAPWFVAEGNPEEIKNQLILFFGLEGVDDNTPHEVALAAVVYAQATAAASLNLAAVPERRDSWPSRSDRPAAPKNAEPAKPKGPEPEGPAENPLQTTLDAVQAAQSKEALLRIWVTLPKDAQANPEVKAAFDKRFAAL